MIIRVKFLNFRGQSKISRVQTLKMQLATGFRYDLVLL